MEKTGLEYNCCLVFSTPEASAVVLDFTIIFHQDTVCGVVLVRQSLPDHAASILRGVHLLFSCLKRTTLLVLCPEGASCREASKQIGELGQQLGNRLTSKLAEHDLL